MAGPFSNIPVWKPVEPTLSPEAALTQRVLQRQTAPQSPPPTPGTPTQPGQPGQPQPVDPAVVAQQVLQSIIQNAPRPNDPKYATAKDPTAAYQNGYLTWQQMLTQATATSKAINELQAGTIDIGGGRYITQQQYNALPPQQQQQVAGLYAQLNAKTTNDYNSLMNTLGLEAYKTADAARAEDNSALSSQFQNQLGAINQQIALGNANVNQAAQAVSRAISGINASTTRANDITNATQNAGPRIVDPSQIPGLNASAGAALGNIARYAGSPTGVPQLNLLGTQTLNPAGLMSGFDTSLGVNGPLPSIPNPFTGITPMTASQAPTPKLSTPMPNLLPYVQPPSLPIPSSTTPVPTDQFGEPVTAGR